MNDLQMLAKNAERTVMLMRRRVNIISGRGKNLLAVLPVNDKLVLVPGSRNSSAKIPSGTMMGIQAAFFSAKRAAKRLGEAEQSAIQAHLRGRR